MNSKLSIRNMKASHTYAPRTGEVQAVELPAFADLDAVMTIEEAVMFYGVMVQDAFIAVTEGTIASRKSGNTWLVRRVDVVRMWAGEGTGRGITVFAIAGIISAIMFAVAL